MNKAISGFARSRQTQGSRFARMKTNAVTLLNLHGQTALISGASGHIGQQISRTLANQAQKEGFAPDILVNNAARQDVVDLSDMTEADWRAMFDATLHSAFALSRAVCGALIKDGKPGAVVNIASIEGLAAAPGHAHYASAKAALIHFTRAAALEYGPHHIRVNAVSPGLINRPGLDKDWPDGVARWKASAPLGRLGATADVANAVLYLCSPMASWVSGENLIVDGGMLSGPNW